MLSYYFLINMEVNLFPGNRADIFEGIKYNLCTKLYQLYVERHMGELYRALLIQQQMLNTFNSIMYVRGYIDKSSA